MRCLAAPASPGGKDVRPRAGLRRRNRRRTGNAPVDLDLGRRTRDGGRRNGTTDTGQGRRSDTTHDRRDRDATTRPRPGGAVGGRAHGARAPRTRENGARRRSWTVTRGNRRGRVGLTGARLAAG